MTKLPQLIRNLMFGALSLAATAVPAADSPQYRPPALPSWSRVPTAPVQLAPGAGQEAEEIASGRPTEVIVERYPNRAVKTERAVKQDEDRNYVNHGPWKRLDPQGRVEAEGQYLDGKRQGAWVRHLISFPAAEPEFKGPFESRAEFQNGELHGTWTIVDSAQRKVGKWTFARGVLHGEATIWFANGQPRQTMHFREGQPDGESVAWRKDGQLWGREHYRQGKQLVPVVTWHDREQKESEGWMLRSNFVIHAELDWWNGVIEIVREDTEGSDVRIGEWKEWAANGALVFQGSYEHGVPAGSHVWWHENGQKRLTGRFESGLREGRWTAWYPNGRKQEEGMHVAGEKVGVWIVWDTDGIVEETQHLAAAVEELPGVPLSPVSIDE